jgi:hypothetical protein
MKLVVRVRKPYRDGFQFAEFIPIRMRFWGKFVGEILSPGSIIIVTDFKRCNNPKDVDGVVCLEITQWYKYK